MITIKSLTQKLKEPFLVLIFLTLLTILVFYKIVFIASTSVISSFWILYGVIVSLFLVSRIPYAYLYEDNHEIQYPDALYPSVSVIIATKNEEQGIFNTIATCIESHYSGGLECIVINDGSTDNTENEIKRAIKVFGERVKIINFPENRGKREAMAVGVEAAESEVIVFVDSDSFLAKKALRHITEHFLADERVGAVSGNTKVENIDKNFLTKMQSIQYAVSFDVYKTCESVNSAVTCCPGCFSAYRAEAIKPLIEEWKKIKFFGSKSTFGDDRGLTNFVLKNWLVIYCEKAQATTVVPERFYQYWHQQLRWKKSWIREGLLACLFMWRKNLLASLSFYIHFSFPFLGPILVINVLYHSLVEHNPFLFILFALGFVLIGIIFALFVRVYRRATYWAYLPLFSILFVSAFIWQMPYAMLTVRNTHWGTR